MNIIINFKQQIGNISNDDIQTIISQRTDIMKHSKFSEMNDNSKTDKNRLESEVEYDKMVQKDHEIQQKAVALEYINIKTCKKLYANSKAYLKELQSMSKKEKIDMWEIENYDSDTDQKIINDKNHFILHTSNELVAVIP